MVKTYVWGKAPIFIKLKCFYFSVLLEDKLLNFLLILHIVLIAWTYENIFYLINASGQSWCSLILRFERRA